MTGKLPDKPEEITDVRDMWKVDTGVVDSRGNKIMIDAMTYDKDYYRVVLAPLLDAIRTKDVSKIPEGMGKAVWNRLQGMKAPSVDMVIDLMDLARGKKILDWKNDEIVDVTDTRIQKILKIIAYETKFVEPFVVSNIKQSFSKEVDSKMAIITALIGLRFTRDEETKEEYKIWRSIYEHKDSQEALYTLLWKTDKPREELKRYNEAIERLYSGNLMQNYLKRSSKDITATELDKDKEDLLIDEKELLSNKIGELSSFKIYFTPERKQRLIKYLDKFGIKTYKEAKELLLFYFKKKHTSPKKAREKLAILKEIYNESLDEE